MLGEVGAAGIDDDHRNACGDRVLDRRAQSGGIGNRDHQAIGLRGCGGIDHLGHLHHVESFRRQVFRLDAEGLGGIVHAVLDDRPIGVAALAMGDEYDAGSGCGGEGQAE